MTGTQIIVATRDKLLEITESFFLDARLLEHINEAVSDLWRAIADNFQDYFFDIDVVTMAAAGTSLTSVPTNVAKVLAIEPADMGTYGSLKFVPESYNSAKFQAARAQAAIDPSSGGIIYYAITGAGGPVGAPTIYVAPRLSSAVSLSLIHTPTVPKMVGATENPIPGESDSAIIAYTIAHALAKEREDKTPHPDWLAKYATEKTNILTFLTPRQNDEPDVAEGVHEPWIDG